MKVTINYYYFNYILLMCVIFNLSKNTRLTKTLLDFTFDIREVRLKIGAWSGHRQHQQHATSFILSACHDS